MSDRDWIEPIVGRVVGQVLDSHAGQLRGEIVRRVMEEIAAQPATAATASASASDLARAVSEIHLGTSQKEILRGLLDSCSRYAARVALFVVKGTHATGWQARGFSRNEAVKDFALDANAPAVVRAIADRVAAAVPVAEFDAHFLKDFGGPASGQAQVLPLILKDKVAALVYADGGSDGTVDAGSLEVLVLATGAWLEVNTLRKQTHKDPHAASGDGHGSAAVPTASASAFNDPFAAHAPAYAMAAAASADSAAVAVSPIESVEKAALGEGQGPASEPQSPTSSLSAEDQEVHRKAQRFARLLVDEIKLYNQAKVTEGRKNHDLYDRLKDTIDKSRGTYQKRYGNTVAGSANYFEDEVKRSLAEDDLSIMGPNFRM